MNGYQRMTRAYRAAVNTRPQREQDAEVFDIFAARLREAEPQGGLPLAKALADNRKLWHTVYNVSLDDNNPQPPHMRKSMLILANTVLKEMANAQPDIPMLIKTNSNIADGLRGIAPSG